MFFLLGFFLSAFILIFITTLFLIPIFIFFSIISIVMLYHVATIVLIICIIIWFFITVFIVFIVRIFATTYSNFVISVYPELSRIFVKLYDTFIYRIFSFSTTKCNFSDHWAVTRPVAFITIRIDLERIGSRVQNLPQGVISWVEHPSISKIFTIAVTSSKDYYLVIVPSTGNSVGSRCERLIWSN